MLGESENTKLQVTKIKKNNICSLGQTGKLKIDYKTDCKFEIARVYVIRVIWNSVSLLKIFP